MKPLLVIAIFKTEAGEIEARVERTVDGVITSKAQLTAYALEPWTLVRDVTGGGVDRGTISQREYVAAPQRECPLHGATKDALRASTRAMLAWVM